MQRISQMILACAWLFSITASPLASKEFLTDKEIELIQDAQEIDARTAIYMDAAKARLKAAEERLFGKESLPGDPFEFFTPEDMLEGYYRILQSVMYNLDEAFQNPASGREKVRKALKDLKKTTEHTARELEILKRLAEEKQKEELWNRINQAIEITSGALDGAESGLTRLPPPAPDKKSRNR